MSKAGQSMELFHTDIWFENIISYFNRVSKLAQVHNTWFLACYTKVVIRQCVWNGAKKLRKMLTPLIKCVKCLPHCYTDAVGCSDVLLSIV